MKRTLSLLTVLTGLLFARTASAQSELDLDPDTQTRQSAKKSAKKTATDAVIREIERGFYIKTSIGSTIYIGSKSPLVQAGTSLNIVLGQDVLDKPKASVAWELNIYQALHNSVLPEPQLQRDFVNPQDYIQGDVHMFAAMAGVEGSGYPVRRLGIGGRAGGGIAYAPLLLFSNGNSANGYERVLQELGVTNLPAFNSVLGAVYAGPTIEYYTKLSHFSLGLDAEFLYIIGFDFGVNVSGYLKYTF